MAEGAAGWGARSPHPDTSHERVAELCRLGGSPKYRCPSSCTPRQEERNFRRPDGRRPWPRGPPLPTRGCARGREGALGASGRPPRVRSARSCWSGARGARGAGGAARSPRPGRMRTLYLPWEAVTQKAGRKAPEKALEASRGSSESNPAPVNYLCLPLEKPLPQMPTWPVRSVTGSRIKTGDTPDGAHGSGDPGDPSERL